METQVNKREKSHGRTLELLEQMQATEEILADLDAQRGVARTIESVLTYLSDSLPENLWVEELKIERVDGADFGWPEVVLPVVAVSGRGKDGANPAASVFAAFGEAVKDRLPAGESAIRNTTRGSGRNFEWKIEAHLFPPPPAPEEDEDY